MQSMWDQARRWVLRGLEYKHKIHIKFSAIRGRGQSIVVSGECGTETGDYVLQGDMWQILNTEDMLLGEIGRGGET